MSRQGLIIGLAAAGLLIGAGCASKHADFGEPMGLGWAKTVAVSKVLAEPDAYAGKEIRLAGTVASVCAKKGCWLRMGDDHAADTVFVKFTCPVEGRLIPMQAVGHEAIVAGTLTIEEVSEADARHNAEEAGKSPEEIAKIVGPQKNVRMASPAARVLGMTGDS